MKPLMGIVLFTSNKDYAMPKFLEMLAALRSVDDFDVMWVTDQPHWVPEGDYAIVASNPGPYAEDMLTFGREEIRKEALRRSSTIMIWQGVDCYYDTTLDFKRLMARSLTGLFPVIGALTTNRADATHAILRSFEFDLDASGAMKCGDKQIDISREVIDDWVAAGIPQANGGFPGADAFFVRPDLFTLDFAGHIPWYARVEQGMVNICVEEHWCQKVINDRKLEVWVDPSVRVWHAHDVDLMARRWYGEERPLKELSW